MRSLYRSSTETGEASEKVPSTYDGESLQIGFRSPYMSEYLSTYKNGAEITLKLRGHQSAGLFEPAVPDDVKSLLVIMPILM